jgi:ribA/ribD-fused uncharacterized protein
MEDYLFFWDGILSNFHPISGHAFTSEKIYMAHKAMAFNDVETFNLITNSKTPRDAKKLGQAVKGFDAVKWDELKVPAMLNALNIKFLACKEFRTMLAQSIGKTLVEASPVDRIWGIGFDEENALANIENWGENLLGKCLMRIRYDNFGY